MTRTVTAEAVRAAIAAARPGAPVTVEQTGGGCATLYVGPYGPDGYARVAIGPGRYDWEAPWLSLLYLGDTAVGPDDDGASEPVYPATLAGIVEAAIATYDGVTLAGIIERERAALEARGLGLAPDGSIYVLTGGTTR